MPSLGSTQFVASDSMIVLTGQGQAGQGLGAYATSTTAATAPLRMNLVVTIPAGSQSVQVTFAASAAVQDLIDKLTAIIA